MMKRTFGDNTTFMEMVHPDGGTAPIPVSPRHHGGRSIEFYRARGFLTLEEHAQKQQIAALREEHARLTAEKGKAGGK